MVKGTPSAAEVWKSLEHVTDPEIPVLSIVDLKIVRSVEVQDAAVTVRITPTFTGCPAQDVIAESIRNQLQGDGFKHVVVKKDLAEQWSTDMLDETTRQKLKAFGVAPPTNTTQVELKLPVLCPFCGSSETKLENSFGPTLCKQIYYCDSCRQSFEKFKSL